MAGTQKLNIQDLYKNLGTKLEGLNQKRAVLVDREAQKTLERDSLIRELTNAGININDLPGEKLRLGTEIKDAFRTAEYSVAQFEKELEMAMTPHGAELEA